MYDICKIALITKLATAAKRKAGGIELREIFPQKPILVFYNREWPEGIMIPQYKCMKDFQLEVRQINGENFTFLFPETVILQKAA